MKTIFSDCALCILLVKATLVARLICIHSYCLTYVEGVYILCVHPVYASCVCHLVYTCVVCAHV